MGTPARMAARRKFGGPSDSVAIVGAAIALVARVLIATLVPARRAARADPVDVMRTE